MKIHFTASVYAKDRLIVEYTNIINHLKSVGHKVDAKHILERTESEILESGKEEVLKFQNDLEGWIKSCDCMIADTSFPSVSVGYEIALALRIGKPVLVFYGEGGPPSLLSYYKDEKLVVEKYSPKTYKQIIDSFINFVDSKADLRFTFFITSEIASYLDEVSRKERIPKSVYIRKLIEEDIKIKENAK